MWKDFRVHKKSRSSPALAVSHSPSSAFRWSCQKSRCILARGPRDDATRPDRPEVMRSRRDPFDPPSSIFGPCWHIKWQPKGGMTLLDRGVRFHSPVRISLIVKKFLFGPSTLVWILSSSLCRPKFWIGLRQHLYVWFIDPERFDPSNSSTESGRSALQKPTVRSGFGWN